MPIVPTIAKDLGISVELITITVTSYLVFQGLAPSIWGPRSDVKGRRIAYICTFLVFLGACIGLALTKNYATLVTLRCLRSTGSASTIAIGSGVIGDITTRANRGGYMGVFQPGLLVSVAVGPVIGAALAASLGWRAIFWFLTIYSAAFLLILIPLLPETLRSVFGNGSLLPKQPITKFPLNVYRRLTSITWEAESIRGTEKRIDILGPIRILFSKQACSIMILLAIHYATWQMSITAMSVLFETSYGLSETEIGLAFVANGVGYMIGTLTIGKILNLDYQKIKATHSTKYPDAGDDEFPLEKARLRLVVPFSVLQCLSLLVFGWTVDYQVHIAVPVISTFITGWTAVSIQSAVMTYLVDAFPDKSAAASAGLNIARCESAAGGTSFVMPMINQIGSGWIFTICAGVQVLALSGVVLQWVHGQRWRHEAVEIVHRKDTEADGEI